MYRTDRLIKVARLSRHHRHLAALAGAIAVLAAGVLPALAAPATAATTATTTAKWTTHVFSVTFDGSGKYDYNSQGANGDTGCYMNVSQSASYAFDQLWTIKIGFKSAGRGKFDTKIESINHVDGPQNFGDKADSHLKGKQTTLPDEDCADETIVPNTGTFDCTSKKITLTAFPNPQMKISRDNADLVMEGRAFLNGVWSYSGTDSIPGDKKGCKTYEDDMTYGTDLIPGIIATSKVSMTVKQLNNLKKGKTITAMIAFGKNTQFPRQSACDSVFGKPNVCVIHSQSLSAKFKVAKVR